MEYKFKEIEQKWQKYWNEKAIYKVKEDFSKPKFYVLDMFPYPSGAGLHVGHPLGYIASDIFSRYKRMKGFNVLHPMGYDAFGLPAEQYAIQTGQHPAITTENNIKRYREQLDKIGLSFDWSREFRTSDPDYYKWTQWAFIQMFNHFYNNNSEKAEPIDQLIAEFDKNGNLLINAACNADTIPFSAIEWNKFDLEQKQSMLLNYRIAYLADTMVNWCEDLKTVLANDEVKDGLSVRGGHPVVQRKMRQWSLRVSAYAKRLLEGMETIDWPESLKEMQKFWIGKSEGAQLFFPVKNADIKIEIFTTRPDTIFGSTFMVLAPESEYVQILTTDEYKADVAKYIDETKSKTERERMADQKTTSGQFIGTYAINPFTEQEIPIWISDYVLAGYGTGAIMAVPAHDSRDYKFAQKYGLQIVQVVEGDISEGSYDAKEGTMINSGLLNGLDVKEAVQKIIGQIESLGLGKRKINYRLRDAIFSRQRYWGEPFPVFFKNNLPYTISEKDLPLKLPEIDIYQPTEDGKPPLGRAQNWQNNDAYPFELSTMPGFAGSSAYYLRYMDPHNEKELVSKESNSYWRSVDLYVGGAEHATGHLIYSRFWNKFLFDTGYVLEEEPFKKLINQGMIQGRSNYVYRINGTNTFVSQSLKDKYQTTEIHVDVNIVHNDILDTEAFKTWMPEYKNAEFILDNGKYTCGYGVEKMSKSKYNVVNPDDIIENYGADTLRLYEMFLGPVELSKPWDTSGIEGVHKFLRKYWRLHFDKENNILINNEEPSKEELKILHQTIKKVEEDILRFSFNTCVSAFMICVNELSTLNCNKTAILDPLSRLLAPFAPHIAEEIRTKMGFEQSVVTENFPEFVAQFIAENEAIYPIAFNGKRRFEMSIDINADIKEIENLVMADERTKKYLEGMSIQKVIIVPKRMVNIVVK
jgi:leucyl-tRNA synthetase